MQRAGIGVIVGSLLLSGCATERAPTIIEVPMYQACKEVPPKVIEVPVPVPMACQLNEGNGRVTTMRNGKSRVQRVSQKALPRTPSNKVQVHPYMPGALYQVSLGVTNATMILLQPGETLGAYVTGDKERWDVADIQTGSTEGIRPAVVAKCKWDGTKTNLSITTSKRVYLLELHCTESAYQAMVSWEYPGEGNQMGLVTPGAAAQGEAAMPVQPPGDPERRQYTYDVKLSKGEKPAWMPVAVWDNGEKTIIEFPQDITVGDAPVLYLRTGEGTQAVVNYRVIAGGTMYQVDRLFEHAELVQGEKKPSVVTIKRTGRKA